MHAAMAARITLPIMPTMLSPAAGFTTGRWTRDLPSWAGTSPAEDAVAVCPQGGLGAILHPDPLEEVGQVTLHRLLADAELAGDLLVRVARDHQLEHVALARGQLDPAGGSLRPRGQELGRRLGRERRLTPRGCA
jgi:hypothetical protein